MKKLPTRSVLRGLAIAGGAMVLALGALSLPWHGDRVAEPPRLLSTARGVGPLRAGAAAVNIDLPAGTPIGGFARRSYVAEGPDQPVTARALVLEAPGARVAIASAEVLFVTDPLRRRVEALVADLGLDALLFGATHTHAGPGGYFDELPFELGALGPYDARVFERIAQATADAIRRAAAASAPARLVVAGGRAADLVRSRSGGGAGGRLLSLRLSAAGGDPIAEVLVFAAHPTTLGKRNRRISGDWPGRFLAAGGRGVRLLLQGPIGDQSARTTDGDAATRPDRYAAAVRAADDALAGSAALEQVPLRAASVAVALPSPSPGAVPGLLRRAAATLAWSHVPATARVTALRLGPALLVAVPAEIVSLVDGYAGYVEEEARARRGEGEAQRTYYGPDLAGRLEAGILAAARALED